MSQINRKAVRWLVRRHSVPEIGVRLWMKSRAESGRTISFSSGYCSHLRAKGCETLWGVRVLAVTQSPHPNEVHCGDEAQLVCELIYFAPDFLYADLRRGATFEMMEGLRVVGTGLVLSDFEW